MATQGNPCPPAPTSTEANFYTNNADGEHVSAIIDEIMAGKNIFFDLPDKLTGEMWTLKFHCVGAEPGKEFVTVNIDKAYVAFYNVVYIKSRLGYSGRDFLFYKKRCGSDRSRLVALDYNDQEEAMLSDNMDERKIRFVLTKDQPNDLEVSITPMKHARKRTNDDEETLEVEIDAYKKWLAILKHDNPETDFMDDFREDTIRTYKEWLRHQGDLPDILSYEQQSNDHELSEEEVHGSSKPTADWPSHARRHRKRDPNSSGAFKKEGRGTLKGIAVATKRIKNGDHKLKIEFSSDKLEGPTGPNARSFVDEIVLFTKKKAPLIGVKTWKDIERHVRSSITTEILRRWEFPSNVDAHEKIGSIANERYKGWRSALSSTYKAYNTYAERMKNKPEDVDIVEWHYLMLYFGSEKFQKKSSQNSENRKKQRTKHRMGSKSFSQISFEQRDPETGLEPSDLILWMSTHCKNGEWSDEASQAVFEKTYEKIGQTEHCDLTIAEEDAIFQTTFKETTGCKANRLHGHGYLSKYPTRSHMMDSKFLEQARATAAANQKNIELESQVQLLNEKLANEVAERERILQEKMQALQEEEERKRQALREEIRKEMVAALAAGSQQANHERNTPSNHPVLPADPPEFTLADPPSPTPCSANNVRTSGTNKKGNISTNYISSHALRNAVTKRVQASRGSERNEWVQPASASHKKGTSA